MIRSTGQLVEPLDRKKVDIQSNPNRPMSYISCLPSRRHHSRHECCYPLRIVLSGSSFQGIRAFECIGPENLHLPAVTSLRADDHNPPIPGPVRKHMLDDRSRVPLQLRIAGVMHLDGCWHSASLRWSDDHRDLPRLLRPPQGKSKLLSCHVKNTLNLACRVSPFSPACFAQGREAGTHRLAESWSTSDHCERLGLSGLPIASRKMALLPSACGEKN